MHCRCGCMAAPDGSVVMEHRLKGSVGLGGVPRLDGVPISPIFSRTASIRAPKDAASAVITAAVTRPATEQNPLAPCGTKPLAEHYPRPSARRVRHPQHIVAATRPFPLRVRVVQRHQLYRADMRFHDTAD